MIATMALGLFIVVPLLLLAASVSGTVTRAFSGRPEPAPTPAPSPAATPTAEPAVSRPIGLASTADANVLRFTPRPAAKAPAHPALQELLRSIGA
jgi:hypothetical protein